MTDLLGAERIQFVADLAAAFHDVAVSGAPQWWSLEGPPGWGKTRLVQELFERLASGQDQPAYWPAHLVPSRETVEGVRKRVAPDPKLAQRDALPGYFWWGVSCLSRPGSQFEALVQDLDQFAQHQDGLERRWRELVTRGTRWRRQFNNRRGELGESVVGEGVSIAAGAVNLAVPGLGLLLLLGKWGVERGVSELREVQGHPAISPGRSVAEELGPELERLGNAGLPLVIVVEDAHAADETLVELLARLMAAEASRVLLITTSWPGLLDEPDRAINVLRDRVSARVVRAGDQLPDLSPADRAELARSALPSLDETSSTRLAAKYSNPLALQTACRLGSVRRSAARSTLTDELLASLPEDATGLYDELWAELPESVQLVLNLAALSAPASIGSSFSFGDERWDPLTVAMAISLAPDLLEQPGNVMRDLASADEAYAWVRTAEAWLQRFDEPAHRDVALSAALTEYANTDQAVLHAALAQALTEAGSALEPVRREHADRLLLSLAERGVLQTSDGLVIDAAERVCARLAASPASSDQHALLRVADVVSGTDKDDLRVLQIAGYRAAALARLGRVHDALETYTWLVDDLTRVLGPDHPNVLTSLNDRAVCMARAGQVAKAVEELQGLLVERSRIEGADAVGTLATRGYLATWLGEAGRVDEAIEAYEALVVDRARVLGPAASDTLRTRSNLAWWLGEASRVDDAVVAYEQLLPDVLGLLGPDAPDTLTTRSNLANWLGERNRVTEAIELLQEVVAARSRVLGPEAPDTLRARANLAWWIGVDGRLEEATTALRDVFADRVRVLGDDAPDTLRTRGHLAWFDGQSGNAAAAVAAFQELLSDQVRVLGQDSRDVTTTRDRLHHWQGVLGGL